MKVFFEKMMKYAVIEHILFLVLAIFAAVLFEERLVSDPSYYILRVINTGFFWIELDRYVLAFSQWLPVIGVNLGMGIESILFLYSISSPIFFYIMFLVARYFYKNKSAGFVLILLQTIGIMSGFFVPMFELYYATGLLVLVYTIMYYSNRKSDIFIIAILSFFILTGHPYTYVLYAFIIAIHALKYKFEYLKTYLLIIGMILAVSVYKKFHYNEYEYWKTMEFIHNILHGVYDFAYFTSLAAFLFEYYKELLLVELITVIYLVYRKEYLKTALIFLAFIGTLVMLNISYYGFVHSRYQEQVYFSLSFVVVYPFAVYLLENKNTVLKASLTVLMVLIIIIRLYGIHIDSKTFISRVAEIRTNIEKARLQEGTKFIVSESDLIYDANWSYPIESMLFSSYDNNANTVTICTDVDIDYENNKDKIEASQYLFRRFEIYEIKSLNSHYFQLDSSLYAPLFDSKK